MGDWPVLRSDRGPLLVSATRGHCELQAKSPALARGENMAP
jgi:hypothetical protein